MSVTDFSLKEVFFLNSKKKCRRDWDTLAAKDKQSKERKAFISPQKNVCGTALVLRNFKKEEIFTFFFIGLNNIHLFIP